MDMSTYLLKPADIAVGMCESFSLDLRSWWV